MNWIQNVWHRLSNTKDLHFSSIWLSSLSHHLLVPISLPLMAIVQVMRNPIAINSIEVVVWNYPQNENSKTKLSSLIIGNTHTLYRTPSADLHFEPSGKGVYSFYWNLKDLFTMLFFFLNLYFAGKVTKTNNIIRTH